MRSVLRHPARAALAGALAIAFSAILYRSAEVSPETGAFFRCAYALPALWVFVRLEERLLGPRPGGLRRTAWIAGAFFAADLLFWHHAIEAVGAGLGTVLGNTQVVLVGLIAWALFRERPAPSALAAIPIAMLGIVLISGVLEEGAYGDNPPLGVVFGVLTGIAYSGFLLALRRGAGDKRRVAGPLFDATLASTVLILPVGLASGDLDLVPGLESQAWLVVLALTSQVVGWLLITVSLPRLPAAATSLLLTLQPAAAVVFAAILLGESPSPLQLVGAGAILAGLVVASAGRRSRTPEPVPEQA
jgi:drug/metabolite transporter (DMT)-like permease